MRQGENVLGHGRFYQRRAGDVAHHDHADVLDQLMALFVQGIVAPVTDFGVYRLDSLLVSSPLGNSRILRWLSSFTKFHTRLTDAA
jgi:hypothetical protein